MVSVAVIGAGIAGLTVANELHERGLDVTVFEASGRTGGAIRSERRQGYLVEHGPNTLQRTTPALERLLLRLGMDDEILEADTSAARRYIVRGGAPQPLPTSLSTFITTPVFSLKAKLGLLRELFVSPAPPHKEESIAAFTRRRLGREVLDYAVDPFVGGIFAGDPQQLSLPHAFPRLYELEQQHGSVIRGQISEMLYKMRTEDHKPAPRRRSFTFHDGLQALPDALAAPLGERIQLSTPVTGMTQERGRWVLDVGNDSDRHPDAFDVVVYAAPICGLADLDLDLENVEPLVDVDYPPVAVVATGYRREDVAHPLDGFGALVPRVENEYRILGTLFTSTLFPDRAPEGHVLLTTFVGGARQPHLARLTPEQTRQLAVDDVKRLFDISAPPAFVHQHTWPHAIPQYTLGYAEKKERMKEIERARAGLFFAGNYRRGISITDTIASAYDAVRRIVKQFVPRGVTI